jgi:S-adenosylmethionine:tRNA ribosyltransferase-isomerase
MRPEDFDFHLPESQIAQTALEDRAASRMLVVERASSSFRDSRFSQFPELLAPEDVLVVNNTRVFPARLFGRTDSGASVEIFLVEDLGNNRWETLAKPAKRLRPGKVIDFQRKLKATVADRADDGKVIVEFACDGDFFETIESIGATPLPPYIRRDRAALDSDRDRYQTVFASDRGAIAAPTAGLHFTEEILERIRSRGVSIVEITLHVGYGTFEPVRVEDISTHRVSAERYSISPAAAHFLNAAREQQRRIVAVGTTTTRALEANLNDFGAFTAGRHLAELTITPGYRFLAIGALLTNFHLPKSSLLILVSTFAGYELIMKSYEHAVREGYRFYSYGDCMFIE